MGTKESNVGSVLRRTVERAATQGIAAACVDMHEPFRLSLEEWVPQCRLIYDKFHIMQHANEAVSQIKRAEFFHRGGAGQLSNDL